MLAGAEGRVRRDPSDREAQLVCRLHVHVVESATSQCDHLDPELLQCGQDLGRTVVMDEDADRIGALRLLDCLRAEGGLEELESNVRIKLLAHLLVNLLVVRHCGVESHAKGARVCVLQGRKVFLLELWTRCRKLLHESHSLAPLLMTGCRVPTFGVVLGRLWWKTDSVQHSILLRRPRALPDTLHALQGGVGDGLQRLLGEERQMRGQDYVGHANQRCYVVVRNAAGREIPEEVGSLSFDDVHCSSRDGAILQTLDECGRVDESAAGGVHDHDAFLHDLQLLRIDHVLRGR
mmetsp:Transcript_71699/g.99597  ORF Transcript_71699/g.99597 Transcript_71699/m.99597 type:complete len:292 (-) Transcript_71699:780-1655(-)